MPSPRNWAVPLVALALYGAALAALLWDFWPAFADHALDTRCLACANYDKVDELTRAQEGDLLRTLALSRDYFSGAKLDLDPVVYNLLPATLVSALGRLMPLVTAYNLVSVAAWLANGLAAMALVWWLTRRAGPALLGGFLFCFSPFMIYTHLCRSLDYGLAFPLPLILLLLLVMQRARAWGWVVAYGAGLVLLALVNQYYSVGLGLFLAGWLVLLLLDRGADPDARREALVRFCVGSVAPLLLLAPLIMVELTRLRAERSISKLTIEDNADPSHMIWAFGQATSGWSWLLICLPLAAAALALRSRVSAAHRWLMAGGTAALVLLTWAVLPAARGLMSQLPVLWRMREVDKIAVLPALLLATLAGVELAATLDRLRGRGQRLALGVALLACCGLCLVQGARWWSDVTAGAPRLTLPRQVVARLSASTPDLVVLSAAQDSEHLPRVLQLMLHRRTGAGRLDPPQEALARQGIQHALGLPLRGAGEHQAAPSTGRGPALGHLLRRKCVALVLHLRSLYLARQLPTGRVASALDQLGLTRRIHQGQGLVVALSPPCQGQGTHTGEPR